MLNQDLRNLKRKKSNPRSVYSGRLIGKKPAVLCEEVIDYIKKCGYMVVYNRFEKQKPLVPKKRGYYYE